MTNIKAAITVFLLTFAVLYFIIHPKEDKINYFLDISDNHISYFTSGRLQNDEIILELQVLQQAMSIQEIQSCDIHLKGNQIDHENYIKLTKWIIRLPIQHFKKICLQFDQIKLNQNDFEYLLNKLPQDLEALDIQINLLQNSKKFQKLLTQKLQTLNSLKSLKLNFANKIHQKQLVNFIQKLTVSQKIEDLVQKKQPILTENQNQIIGQINIVIAANQTQKEQIQLKSAQQQQIVQDINDEDSKNNNTDDKINEKGQQSQLKSQDNQQNSKQKKDQVKTKVQQNNTKKDSQKVKQSKKEQIKQDKKANGKSSDKKKKKQPQSKKQTKNKKEDKKK